MENCIHKFGRILLVVCITVNYSTTGVAQQVDHIQKRKIFLEKIQNGIGVISAAPEVIRNGDVNYEYRQDSNFYYLSGIRIPETILVFRPDAVKKYIVFVPKQDPVEQIYDGMIPSPEEIVQHFHADTAYYSNEFESHFSEWLQEVNKVYCHYSNNEEIKTIINRLIQNASIDTIIYAGQIVEKMRLLKSPDEISLIQKAVNITSAAHLEMMKLTEPQKYEYEIEAAIEYIFKTSGNCSPGFSSIVGSGRNSTILHYMDNQKQLFPNELLLVDIGAEFDYYTADITRTIPVDGRFSPEQKAIYTIVLASQKKVIDAIRPDVTIADLHEISASEIARGLVALGLTKEDYPSVMEKKLYREFYPHGLSHHIGLDAHDAGGYKESQLHEPLQPGMVITVEPGIYIREEHDVENRWKNIGVRIEDDILITDSGCKVLSGNLPKDIQSIERIMSETSEYFRK